VSTISSLSIEDTAALPTHLTREREIAVAEMVAHGTLRPANNDNGPYAVRLSVENGRLVVRMTDSAQTELTAHVLSLSPYRRIIADYFLMIESYEAARAGASCSKLEAIDMGRRGLHDEGAALVQERLKDKIEMDHETARRLFTLICVLHKGHARLAS
jgi:uncharacterized protein (UPF0262 family)